MTLKEKKYKERKKKNQAIITKHVAAIFSCFRVREISNK